MLPSVVSRIIDSFTWLCENKKLILCISRVSALFSIPAEVFYLFENVGEYFQNKFYS